MPVDNLFSATSEKFPLTDKTNHVRFDLRPVENIGTLNVCGRFQYITFAFSRMLSQEGIDS